MSGRITARRLATPDGIHENRVVVVDGGTIVAIEPGRGIPDHDLVTAGFIDLQVNGHDDVDVATTDQPGWTRLCRRLVEQGVTSWLPTLTTAPLRRLDDCMRSLGALMAAPGGPEALGIHLEGPFLGRAVGAHEGVGDGPVDLDWIATLPATVRMMTLGPERPGAASAIQRLVERGIVVALGHTRATAEQTEAAIEAGATMFTHLFNASGGFHHRHPGALGVGLSDDRIAVSLIADGIHVDRRALRLAWRAKPTGSVVLVTDAVAWGSGRVADGNIAVVGGAPRRADGTLAGTTLTMPAALRHTVEAVGIDLTTALAAATSAPARMLGLTDRGSITVGLRADLAALAPDWTVDATWVAGVST